MLIRFFFSMLFLNFLQSCNSQNVDLAKLDFPKPKEEVLGKNNDFKKDQYLYALGLGEDYKNFMLYKYTGQPFLNYNNKKIDGKLTEGKRYTNKVEFIVDDEKNLVYGYELSVYTANESLSLIEGVRSYLGKPNYDDADSINRNVIWEGKGCIYYLKINKDVIYNGVKTIETVLTVLTTSLTELSGYVTNPSYYEFYLKERNKKGMKIENYNYSLFVKEQSKLGFDYYKKGIKGLN